MVAGSHPCFCSAHSSDMNKIIMEYVEKLETGTKLYTSEVIE